MFDQRLGNVAHIAINVFEWQVESTVEQDLLDRRSKAAFGRVINMVGRFVGVDEFGRNRAADEDVVVAEVVPVKQRTEHRIVKSLSQLGLQMVAD